MMIKLKAVFSNSKALAVFSVLISVLIVFALSTNGTEAITLPTSLLSTLPTLKVTPKVMSSGANFETVKGALLKATDKALAGLDKAEASIQNNPNIDPTIKQQSLANLNRVEQQLRDYRVQAEATTSMTELQTLNKKTLQYLKDNKDVIKQTVQKSLASIGQVVLVKVEELMQTIEELLKFLKVTCPSERETIEEVEDQLAQLETEAKELQGAIKSKNSAAIKTEIAQISQLAKELATNAQQVVNACNLSVPTVTP